MTVRLLNSPNPFHERRQGHLVRDILHALSARRQSVDEDAADAVLDERYPGADDDDRTSGEKNFLAREAERSSK